MDKFFRINYTGKIKRTGRVFDTTDKEKAKEEDVYNEKLNYGSKLITDEEEMVEGVIETLKDMEEGEEKDIELGPEKAYGKRDPSKIEMVPKKDFEDTKVNPVPGLRVLLDGEPAKIQTVSGGRVRVDFNNPLAGKNLKYHLELIEKIEEDLERSIALTEKLIGLEKEEIDAKEEEETLTIHIPENTIEEGKEETKDKLKEEIKEKTSYKEIQIQQKSKKEEKEE